jgi:hypothetical protein
MRPSSSLAAGLVLGSSLVTTLADAATASCSVRSGPTATPVVELFTSEGCNSCPPADRWMSTLKADPGVVALAFHVDYWDRLGWKDRFASPAYTQRQAQTQASSGARFSYTPQVLVDGADRKDWPRIAAPLSGSSSSSRSQRPAARVDVTLTREADRFSATIVPASGAPARLAAYWALTENGHSTAVKAGENEGVTLKHDYVVREYRPVAAWNAANPVTLRFEPSTPRDAALPAEVNLVVVDADSGRPLQALKLGC